MNLIRKTGAQAPELHEKAQRLVEEAFADFMDHSEIVNRYWWQLYERWPEWQYLLFDENADTVRVLGNCFPLRWEGSFGELPDGGVEWALETAVTQHTAGVEPNTACAFQIIINRNSLGQGLSYRAVEEMITVTRERGMADLLAPVRPNRKENYPDLPFDQYVGWKREDGLPVDDWLRVHVRLGGEVLHPCYRSFVVKGTLEQWEKWTGQRFSKSGKYSLTGGLVPIEVDTASDSAVYTEPNIWVRHDLKSGQKKRE